MSLLQLGLFYMYFALLRHFLISLNLQHRKLISLLCTVTLFQAIHILDDRIRHWILSHCLQRTTNNIRVKCFIIGSVSLQVGVLKRHIFIVLALRSFSSLFLLSINSMHKLFFQRVNLARYFFSTLRI